MEPAKWGPTIWKTIHIIAASSPRFPTDADRARYKVFFTSIGQVLPCIKCRNNFSAHISKLPIDLYLVDRDTLFKWTVDLHNTVNESLGKRTWTVQEAWDVHIGGGDASNKNKTHRIVLAISLVTAFVLVSYWVLGRR